MAECPKCGSQVGEGVKFCAACGSPIAASPSAPASASPFSVPGQPPSAGQGGIASNVAAMLAYVPICLVGAVCAVLFTFILEPYKNDRFIRFHGWQSLVVHGAFIVLWIGWTMISMVLTSMVHVFAIITVPISFLIGLGALVLMVILMIKAYNRETFRLPVVGEWAEKKANGQ